MEGRKRRAKDLKKLKYEKNRPKEREGKNERQTQRDGNNFLQKQRRRTGRDCVSDTRKAYVGVFNSPDQ